MNQKELPWPFLDMAPIWPRSTATCLLQIDRPKPVPPRLLGRFISSSVPYERGWLHQGRDRGVAPLGATVGWTRTWQHTPGSMAHLVCLRPPPLKQPCQSWLHASITLPVVLKAGA